MTILPPGDLIKFYQAACGAWAFDKLRRYKTEPVTSIEPQIIYMFGKGFLSTQTFIQIFVVDYLQECRKILDADFYSLHFFTTKKVPTIAKSTISLNAEKIQKMQVILYHTISYHTEIKSHLAMDLLKVQFLLCKYETVL